MKRTARSLLGAALILALGAPAAAHDLTPNRTVIETMDTTVEGTTVTVSGVAAFGGQRLVRLATDPSGDATSGIAEVDLIEAKMGQLDPVTGDLNFVFKLADLNPAGGIPEAVDYVWEFRVAPLEQPRFRIQTSFTGAVSGGTLTPWAVVHFCPDGFDTGCQATSVVAEYVGSDNEIFVDVPRSLIEQKLGRSIEGLRIAPIDAGSGDINTSFLRGDVDADQVASWSGYNAAYGRVDVGIAPPGGSPSTTVPAVVADGNVFAAELDMGALPPGNYDVVATACYGTNCGSYVTRVSLSA